jgi:hypothetical protein
MAQAVQPVLKAGMGPATRTESNNVSHRDRSRCLNNPEKRQCSGYKYLAAPRVQSASSSLLPLALTFSQGHPSRIYVLFAISIAPPVNKDLTLMASACVQHETKSLSLASLSDYGVQPSSLPALEGVCPL